TTARPRPATATRMDPGHRPPHRRRRTNPRPVPRRAPRPRHPPTHRRHRRMITQTARIPTTELATYHRNPRRGNLKAIAESLKTLGQYRPIVVNAGTHTGRPDEVLAGNHTLLAARELGWVSIDGVTVDVDDDTAARIVLVDNRSNDLAGYDDEVLAGLLSDLPDLTATGYTDEDLEALLDDIGRDSGGIAGDPDDVPDGLAEA